MWLFLPLVPLLLVLLLSGIVRPSGERPSPAGMASLAVAPLVPVDRLPAEDPARFDLPAFDVPTGPSSPPRAIVDAAEPLRVADPESIRPSAPADLHRRLLVTADSLLGIPYRYGGSTPTTGFDCSGFVQWIYARHGIRLPRTSRAQASVGSEVEVFEEPLRPGDLLFFAAAGDRIDHVGVYAGKGKMVHASETGGDVRVSALGGPGGSWYRAHLVTVRRP